jgi:transposase
MIALGISSRTRRTMPVGLGPSKEDDEDKGTITEVRGHIRRNNKRRHVPPSVERRAHDVPVKEDDLPCQGCGKTKTAFGHEVCQILYFEPARFVLHEYHLEKVRCRPCGAGLATAPGPGKIIEGGLAGSGLLATILVDKYRDGLPLHRRMDDTNDLQTARLRV